MPDDLPHPAHLYGERLRRRLPRRMQEVREALDMSKYALAKHSGISAEMIGRVERGLSNPTLPVPAQISYGLGLTLREFVAKLEEGD